jgi:hypothetical protein
MGGISVSSLGSIDWCQKSLNIIFFIILEENPTKLFFFMDPPQKIKNKNLVGLF